jgi:AraC family transcriptional regulator, melibiose operon regulatory protein
MPPLDLSHFLTPKRLSFTATGQYLIEFPDGLPIQVHNYDYSHSGLFPFLSIPNYHDFLEISCIYRGSGVFDIDGKTLEASRGDFFAIDSGIFHFLEAPGAKNLHILSLYFLPELIYQPGDRDLDLEYLLLFSGSRSRAIPKVSPDPSTGRKIVMLMKAIADELDTRGSYYRLSVKNHLCEILLHLNRAARVSGSGAADLGARLKEINRLTKVFAFIHERYAEKFSLDDLAAASNMSGPYLSRYFKRVTGKTITEYLKRFRVDRAKELLMDDERSISWIAYEVGFESHSYFDRIFHEVTRRTPLEFRRRFRRKLRQRA